MRRRRKSRRTVSEHTLEKRGQLKAAMEATWDCLSYNLARWFSLRHKLSLQPALASRAGHSPYRLSVNLS